MYPNHYKLKMISIIIIIVAIEPEASVGQTPHLLLKLIKLKGPSVTVQVHHGRMPAKSKSLHEGIVRRDHNYYASDLIQNICRVSSAETSLAHAGLAFSTLRMRQEIEDAPAHHIKSLQLTHIIHRVFNM